jgi:hypothetical protein
MRSIPSTSCRTCAGVRRGWDHRGNVFAVTVHDLTEQCDFFHALFCQRADFANNIANGARTFAAAFGRDDAEGAGVRTAVDDRHMRADEFALLGTGV